MPDGRPELTVVVRSHNDIQFMERTLRMLLSQTMQKIEILCIDDHSTDGTREVIASFPEIRCLTAPAPYMPGKILNFAVREAAADLIVFNNSDAIPLETSYLEKLTAPLRSQSGIAAVYGNQVCRPDAEPLVRKDYERAFGDGRISAGWKHFFSMASSAARRKELEQYPFCEMLRYSEDIEWSWRLKQQGLKIQYVPEARVEHSHNYTKEELRKRFYNEGVADREIFHETLSAPRFLRQLGMECLRDACYLLKQGKILSLPDGLSKRIVQKYAYYKGNHS